ncbi:MAG: type II toxin-antitoxin system PemK/MazF family toxin [Coriobacteriales bacterium]|nr:type II toxin-antitoxin system PemK/MazF family toxin [Coriobacteriales bacterium]
MSSYIPRQGDIIWCVFDPRKGHEQQGRRPAVVASNGVTNAFLNGRAMVCPISNTNKGYPIQPALDGRTRTQGVILCDQAMVLDLKARKAEFVERVPDDILADVVDIIIGMVELL